MLQNTNLGHSIAGNKAINSPVETLAENARFVTARMVATLTQTIISNSEL